MMHPLAVTRILADMQMDMVCLETGLLHDVVEDTDRQHRGDLSAKFGEDVARCVDGVTKLSKISSRRIAKTGRRRACARCCWR